MKDETKTTTTAFTIQFTDPTMKDIHMPKNGWPTRMEAEAYAQTYHGVRYWTGQATIVEITVPSDQPNR